MEPPPEAAASGGGLCEGGKGEQSRPPLHRVGCCGVGGITDYHASDVGHWLAMTAEKPCHSEERSDVGIRSHCRVVCPCPPGSVCSLWCVGEGLSCPPLCRPISGHCRARQSGHFLETGLLHPPLAALRRFPLPRATARVAPTKALQGVRGKWRIYRGLPGEGQRGGNFWLNLGGG